MNGRLEVVKGAASKTLRLEPGRPATIGRSQAADLQIVSGLVSRLHCKIQFDGRVWILTDLDSRNGTWIGTKRIKSRLLDSGTIFTLGQRIAVRFSTETVAARPPVAPPSAPGEAANCSFCGRGAEAARPLVPGGADRVFHKGCLTLSGLVGTEVGGVRVIERLDGLGAVHRLRAHQPSLNRHVLLYAFDESVFAAEDFRGKLLNEVRAVSRLLHPKILQIHDLVEHQGSQLVVTEFLPGETLRDLLLARKFVKVPAALSIANQVVDGLAYAEAQEQTVDRLSPADIVVTEDYTAKVDFFRPPLPGGPDPETLRYVAPEVVSSGRLRHGRARPAAADRGSAARSSVYSVGAILYHMLAGIPPFDGSTEEELMPKVLRGVPPPLARVNLKVSPALARVVERAMAKDPEGRPADFRTFQIDLKKIVSPAL